ncbi:prolyl 3-hydroxylase OGFOD1 isoform X2 [Frieseomelitta varia]|uniref:prolyl 3-hydroxylase OGFOD1 isoform X2 n=1 Tax=Frieseomelitta varia TaxID=561572 RepID=UPI001CB6816E|nr:prolyl 3-hydroxylase OGFOD1 isoform X2 [Frieseomelitta varia]
MADREPQQKRKKQSVISDFLYSAKFQKLFSEHWHNRTDIKTDNFEVISKPFRVCRISNFICNEELMDEIKNELLDVRIKRNCIDLYQFEQTEDLITVDREFLNLLYMTFESDLSEWMERNTKIRLSKKISMSSSCYYDTDYLLCHDDNMGDRKIAFVLYLSKDWTEDDGGALDLFDTDENNLPRNVVKSLIPEYNSLVFFEVLENSFHQVAEIKSPNKSRWSINGWFHGPLRPRVWRPRTEILSNYIDPTPESVDLDYWISQCYLFPKIIKQIHEDVERNSYTFLSDYLKDEIYATLRTDLASDSIVWKKVGPADIRNYEVADEETLPDVLKKFYNMFKSTTMFQLLKDYTELDLVVSEEEVTKPRMQIELQRWTSGCYTLICDKLLDNEPYTYVNDEKCYSNIYSSDSEENASNNSNDDDKNNTTSECNTSLSSPEQKEFDENDPLQKIIHSRCARTTWDAVKKILVRLT